MKIKELIEKLKELPQDANVIFDSNYGIVLITDGHTDNGTVDKEEEQ